MIHQDQESGRLLDEVLNAVEAAIWMKDTDHRYILMNQEFKDLFSIDSTTEVLGHTDAELFPESIATQFQANDRQAMEAGEPVEIEEKVQTDDEERIYLTRITPVYDDNNTIYATCGVASDITGQRQREGQLQQERERLEEFASIVSHDLRSPLNVVEGHLELVREDCQSEHLDDIARAVERMNALIEDLLTLAREGETVGDTEPIDLVNLSENCWRNVATADATLRTDFERTIKADQSRLQQLLENLMRNAVEHGAEDVTVTMGELDDGFYVEDDGPGISENEQDDVFEAGYSTAEDGTGFGLSIVKQVAQAHGWDVRVTDGSDGGARFEITGVKFTVE